MIDGHAFNMLVSQSTAYKNLRAVVRGVRWQHTAELTKIESYGGHEA